MNIYVGGLARTVTEEALKKAFEQFGQVNSAKVIKDRITGELRGFGFVDMPNPAEAQQAIAGMNGRDLEGMKLKVNEAREPEAGPRRSSGGYNGGGRSSGGYSGGRSSGGGYNNGGGSSTGGRW